MAYFKLFFVFCDIHQKRSDFCIFLRCFAFKDLNDLISTAPILAKV